MKLLLIALALSSLSANVLVQGDSIQAIATQTDDCVLCGMSAGEVSIKVCGNLDCCLAIRLDNSDITFLPGAYDVFTGEANLKECYNYQIGDKNAGPISITVIHEGSDGLDLDYVEIETDDRTVVCDGIREVDGDGDFVQVACR